MDHVAAYQARYQAAAAETDTASQMSRPAEENSTTSTAATTQKDFQVSASTKDRVEAAKSYIESK